MGARKTSRSKKAYLAVVAGLLLAAIGGGLVWRHLRPRVIHLVVVSDYSFRERRDWDTVLDARFKAVNRIFRGTGVEWQVLNAEHMDPVGSISQLDARRMELERREDSPSDVVISVTGKGEGDRLGSVNPFSHAAVIVDFPQQSEAQNTVNLAHELARLFAAPDEPADSGTAMALPPRNPVFGPRTVALIRQLRDYDFAAGIDFLKEKWERKAVEALAESYTTPSPKPLSRAHVTLALALEAEKHAAEAVPQARDAVKADPRSSEARQALAHALMDDLQMEAATRELREAIRLFPGDASLHAYLGMALAKQAETEEGLKELHAAEALDPKNPNFRIAIGSLLVSQTGRIDEALAEFQKAVQLDPQQPAAQLWVHRVEDVTAQARADLETDRLKERASPQDAELHFHIGVDEARLGHHENARQEFQKAVDLNPRNGRAFADLAAMDAYANDYDAAWRHVRAARAAGVEPPDALVTALERKRRAAAGDGAADPAARGK
jgi:Tfp pilus assembly protein PilF